MGTKRVDHYKGSSLFGFIGHTEINEETGEQKHYGIGPLDYLGSSKPNAYGGLDHHTVGGYNTCVGHTNKFGGADVHTGVSVFDVLGRTEHYDGRDVHTNLDGISVKGFSSSGGRGGFHEFFMSSRDDARWQEGPQDDADCEDSESGSSHRRIYYEEARNEDSIHHQDLEDYKNMTDDEIRERRGVRIQKLVDYYYHLDDPPSPPPRSRIEYHEWKESDSFLPRISFPPPRFSDNQILLGITAAVTAIVIGTIFVLSYWQEICNFMSRIRHGETPAAVIQPYNEPERPRETRVAPEEEKAAGVVREAPLRPASPAPLPSRAPRANDDGHRGPRVVPDTGERPSAQAETLSDVGFGRRRHPGDYDVVGFECSKVNNNRLRCDAYLRDGRWRAVTCDRIGTGRIHSCGPFGPGHDRQEFDVRWILRNKPARTKHEPPPRPPRLVRRY